MAYSKKDLGFVNKQISLYKEAVPSYFLGIDQKPTKAQVLSIREDLRVVHNISVETFSGGTDLLFELQTALSQAIKVSRPCVAMIEGYAYGARFHSHQMGEVGAALKMVMVRTGVPFLAPAPLQVKQYCLGKGSGKKNLMLKGVYKKWGIDFSSDDEADAYTLAVMARDAWCSLTGRPVELKSYEKEVMDKVLNPPAKTFRRKGGSEDAD